MSAHAGSPAAPEESRARLALAALALLYAAVYSAACVVKYRAFLYDDIDLAIFTQALANLMHGSLGSSLRGMSWLGDHSSLNLFLLAPLYAIARTPLTLLIVQSVALALGALPVYRLARRELDDPWTALLCAALYLLQPALGYVNLFEFHPEALAIPALLAAIVCLRENRTGWMALWAGVALLGKEDVALVVAALGLYALWLPRPGRLKRGLALLGLAAASLVVSFAWLKPALGTGAADYGAMYSHWGGTPREVLASIARRPLAALGSLYATPLDARDSLIKQQYWIQMLLPLGFLPLAAPGLALVALPIAFEHMLSWRAQQHGIVYQYTALVTPFFAAAAVLGLGRLARRVAAEARVRTARRIAALAVLAAALAQAMYGPLEGAGILQAQKPLQRTQPDAYDRAMAAEKRRLLARIPAEGGVVAGFDLLAPLAKRAELHSLHHVLSGKYTFSSRAFPTPGNVAAVIADWSGDRLMTYPDSATGARLRELVTRNRLAPIAEIGDLVLYLRDVAPGIALVSPGADSTGAKPVEFDRQLAFLGAKLPAEAAEAGGALAFRTSWRRIAPADRLFLTEWLVLDAASRTVFSRTRHLGYMIAPPSDWESGAAMTESYRLPLPATLAPGRYTLWMRVGHMIRGHASPADAGDRLVAANDGMVRLGEFEVMGGAANASR